MSAPCHWESGQPTYNPPVTSNTPSVPPEQQLPGPGPRLRVLSYNIQVGIQSSRYHHFLTNSWKHLLPYKGRQDNLDRIAAFISEFDIVGLQEVDAGSLRSTFINQTEYLAERAGFSNWYSQTNRNFGRFAKHSMGLLSRMPPHTVIEHKLPGAVPGRGALEAHFGSLENPLVVVQVHLALVQKTRAAQLAYIAEVLQDHEYAIVLGDMNCMPSSTEVRRLVAATHLADPHHDTHTFPSWRPTRCYDQILVTPHLQVEETQVYPVYYSDHLPVGMDLSLPAQLACALPAEESTGRG
ncbi:MAG TPA: EEP domain-containing protein [Thioalkalivibrio sp.]|nr:EEP domain-containing protein [Thioalkalivibrio sp.]